MVVLFAGEIVPKTLGKRHPIQVTLATIHMVQALCFVLWPVSALVTRITGWAVGLFGSERGATPAVAGEGIEYLIEMGTREGQAPTRTDGLRQRTTECAGQGDARTRRAE